MSKDERGARPREPGTAGFTLLEVLAAVAILGIVYTLLADWAIQGLWAEGEAQRRLRASLLADRILFDIEAGSTPPSGLTESQEDGFLVKVDVVPFDLAEAGLLVQPARGSEGREGGQAGAGGLSILSAGPQSPPSLRRIDVQVSWTEGVREAQVIRTTFVFDREAVRPLLDQLDAEALTAQGGLQ